MARVDRKKRRSDRRELRAMKGTTGLHFKVTSSEARPITQADRDLSNSQTKKHTVENAGNKIYRISKGGYTETTNKTTGEVTRVNNDVKEIILDKSKGIDKRDEQTKKEDRMNKEAEANARGSETGEFLNDEEFAIKKNEEAKQFNAELEASGNANLGTPENPIKGESFSGESVRKYNALKLTRNILIGADIVLALAVGAAGAGAGAAGVAATNTGREVIIRTATAKGGITTIAKRAGVTITESSIKAGQGVLSKITTRQGLKSLMTPKNLIIAGSVSGGASMANWIVSDNVLSQTGMQAGSIADAVTFGGLDRVTALEKIDELEAVSNRATRNMKVFLAASPTSWPFVSAYLLNAEVSRNGLKLARESINSA